ncbi:MAG: hypothetical protein ACREUM_09545 [Nitrosospira sp.]
MLKTKLSFLVSGSLLAAISITQNVAASSHFDNFNALSNSVAVSSLPDPFQLSSPLLTPPVPGIGTPTATRWKDNAADVNAGPTGLYFDKFNPDIAYVQTHHAESDVDRIIQISVSKEKTYPMMLAAIGVMGAVVRRRVASAP